MLRPTTLFALIALALACAAPAAGQTPAPTPAVPVFDPGQVIPTEPNALAGTIVSNQTALHSEIDRWRAEGDPAVGAAPLEVTNRGTFHLRVHVLLAARPRLFRQVVKLLPPKPAADARDIYVAMRSLRRLAGASARSRIRYGASLPADQLLAHYREAYGRFRVRARVLAAVNLVETRFNRLRNNSSAGAQGPMQFMPATWRAYGMGGKVRNVRDAILGAANYLKASGAPRNYRRALYAYNHSRLYVEAVRRYSRVIARDPHTFYVLHSWHFYRGSGQSFRRITGPEPRSFYPTG
ncbi:MAG TPA: lytic transglycosylase domain-containing protein [Longimicrobium sp.]|nr:lytic transglycosylase domain-containing protein [Longimicrobium sp.]